MKFYKKYYKLFLAVIVILEFISFLMLGKSKSFLGLFYFFSIAFFIMIVLNFLIIRKTLEKPVSLSLKNLNIKFFGIEMLIAALIPLLFFLNYDRVFSTLPELVFNSLFILLGISLFKISINSLKVDN